MKNKPIHLDQKLKLKDIYDVSSIVGNKIRKYKLDFKFFNNNILNKWPISINKNKIIFEIGISLQWKSFI